MSDFNRLFKNSYNECLKQADKSFWVGIVSGITGLLFFVAALSVIYFANTKTNFDLLNKNFDNEIKKVDDGIKKIDKIKIEKEVFPLLVNKIFPEANNKLLSNNRSEKAREDSQQKKFGNKNMIEKNKNN